MRARALGVIAVASVASACSFGRFDSVQKDAPIVLLKKPDELGQGFGVSVATTRLDDEVRLFVGGGATVSGGAVFDLTTGEDPGRDAIDLGACDPDLGNDCFLALEVAGAPLLIAPDGMDRELCFIIGIGATPRTGDGVLVRCDDNTEWALQVPDSAQATVVDRAIVEQDAEALRIATDRTDRPTIIVGAPRSGLAWFYGSDSRDAVELVPGPFSAPVTFGQAVASAVVGDTRLLAVSAPEDNEVWLFRSDDASSAELLGCIGGTPGFGKALAAGLVDGDTTDELLVSDDANVHVLRASALLDLDPPASGDFACTFGSLPPSALYASFGCGSDADTTGCDTGDFGAQLAVADLDGDGDGEALVGVPRMTTRRKRNAGAVLVYDVEVENRERLSDVKFLATASEDDELGSALAAPRLEGRDIIAAGGPGNGKTALFYCGSLVTAESDRCK